MILRKTGGGARNDESRARRDRASGYCRSSAEDEKQLIASSSSSSLLLVALSRFFNKKNIMEFFQCSLLRMHMLIFQGWCVSFNFYLGELNGLYGCLNTTHTQLRTDTQ
jgi:hypothetical protein